MHDDATIITIDGNPFVSFNGELRPVPRGGADDVTPPAPAAETPEPEPAPEPVAGDGEEVPAEEPEAIPDLPADIESVDEDALYALHEQLATQLSARREGASTPADVAAVQSIAERMNAISGELERRRIEAQEVADQLTALDQSLPQALPERTPQPAMAGAGTTAAQLAAARTPQVHGQQTPPAPKSNRPRVALLAGAGASNVPAGQEMDWGQLGAAFDIAKQRGRGDTILASLPAFTNGDADIPEMLSTDNGAARNSMLIDEAVADWRARMFETAMPSRQGAICEPFDIIRDIPDAFSTSEPVRGVFPARPAGRLGFQYVRSIGLADVAGGADMWFDADQAAVDPDDSDTWKPCVEIDCPDVLTASAEAVTACLTFDITTEMSAPERVRNFTNALMALKSRVKEGRILQRVDALSHSYQFFGDYGALPAVVEALNTVLAQLTYADRLEDTNYVLLVPPGVSEILTIDRANRAYNNDATEDVLSYLKANVEGISSIVSTLDASRGSEPSVPFKALTPITDPPSVVTVPYISGGNFRFRLVEPAAAIYAETGEMNVGTTRDARLIRMNKTQYFTEEFFFLAKHGPQPWATIDINLCADGSRAGLITPAGCDVS